MPRRLPWAQNGTNIKVEPPRQKTPDVRNLRDSRRSSPDRSRSMRPVVKRRQRSRSHSTSPPPGPPSVEPMREGFEEDDIWMMVEDEFEALAKTFTAHLHHAEYKKLVRKARDAPPKELSTTASSMSKETIRRIQRDNLRQKQQETMAEIGAGSGGGTAEDNVEDPWRGTSIAGLIASGSEEKRSLKGIDRLPSSTRAAQGFARPDSKDDEHTDAEPATPQKPSRSEQPTGVSSSRHAATSAPASKPAQVSRYGPEKTVRRSLDSVSKKPASNASSMPPPDHTQPTVTAPAKTPLLAQRKKIKKEESREERLSEVPMFSI